MQLTEMQSKRNDNALDLPIYCTITTYGLIRKFPMTPVSRCLVEIKNKIKTNARLICGWANGYN